MGMHHGTRITCIYVCISVLSNNSIQVSPYHTCRHISCYIHACYENGISHENQLTVHHLFATQKYNVCKFTSHSHINNNITTKLKWCAPPSTANILVHDHDRFIFTSHIPYWQLIIDGRGQNWCVVTKHSSNSSYTAQLRCTYYFSNIHTCIQIDIRWW